MKLDKTSVCVFIESESHLQQARELLERYKQPIFRIFEMIEDGSKSILKFRDGVWYVGFIFFENSYKITLSELEEILKEEV